MSFDLTENTDGNVEFVVRDDSAYVPIAQMKFPKGRSIADGSNEIGEVTSNAEPANFLDRFEMKSEG